jgi:protein-L-isoaspartate(D-aspartate) O-methyltransferase
MVEKFNRAIKLGIICGLLFLALASCRPADVPDAAPSNFGDELPTAVITEAGQPEASSEEPDPFQKDRERMVADQIEARGVSDPKVLESMRQVPRHRFVPDEHLARAYGDHPLPIGSGQTISQPYIVALMSEALQASPGDRVLEIGTGSGYQAAVLAEMGLDVYTVEIIPELAERARVVLDELGYTNVMTRTGDGYFGWDEYAPFDAIMVTAAPDHLPQPLVEQLKEGGRLVIPIGPVGSFQTLWLFEKIEGELQATNLGSVIFVPLTR